MSLLNDLPYPLLDRTGWPWNEDTPVNIYDATVSWPKISIVTPTLNQGKYIEETIRSVLLQNYPNLEYIIIDGGSSDETVDIIKKYQPWLTYWVSEPDRGQSHAINKGLSKCTGVIFNWLNSDDWFTPKSLYKIAQCFLKNSSIAVVSGYENHINLNGSYVIYEGTCLKRTLEQTLEKCHISQPSTFFKLKELRGVGAISEDLHYLMDAEMWMRYLTLYGDKNFLKINEPVVNFRFHDDSKSVNFMENNFVLERNSIINDLQKYIELPDQIRSYWREYIFGRNDVKNLTIDWNLNQQFISKEKLRIFYIKRFINRQFQDRNPNQAYWGIKELIKNNSYDLFLIRSIVKLLYNKLK
jgi:glycosyltransferase involved in cell wall biosynthesis